MSLHDKQRIDFFDAMRGFAMFLVVLAHIQGFWFGASTGIVERFRMPLFFFVSGFFSYSAVYDRSMFVKHMKSRFKKQLVPTIVICAAFCSVLTIVDWRGGVTLSDILLNENKMGYWFTLSLVEVFMGFAVTAHLIYMASLPDRWQPVLWIVVLGVVQAAAMGLDPILLRLSPGWKNIDDLFGLHQTMMFAPYFFFGVLCRVVERQFFAIMSRWWVVAVLAVVFYVAAISVSNKYLFEYVSRYAGVLVAVGIFYAMRGIIRPDHWFWSRLIYVGKNTLPVYLYHYFLIIFGSFFVADLVDPAWLDGLSGVSLMSAMSVAIIAIVLAFDSLFKRYVAPVHQFVFGR